MKKYTELELKDILEKHSLWLREDRNGERANLRGADLREADLSRANLSRSDLSEAILCRADLSGADLNETTLLTEADLRGVNLSGANLIGVKDINYSINCPEKGSFIGFKKVSDNLIVELEITEDALRSSATIELRYLTSIPIDGTNAPLVYISLLVDKRL